MVWSLSRESGAVPRRDSGHLRSASRALPCRAFPCRRSAAETFLRPVPEGHLTIARRFQRRVQPKRTDRVP